MSKRGKGKKGKSGCWVKATKKGKGKKGSLIALEETQATTAVAKPDKETKVPEDQEVVEEYWVDTSGHDAAWCEHQGDDAWYG